VSTALHDKLTQLAQSSFRARFHLKPVDLKYIRERGIDAVMSHAREFIATRLAPASPTNDGKQTPWRGHPVFVAQHATATCCRGCLQKWHQIPKGRVLTPEEQQYIVEVIRAWLSHQEEISS